MPILWLLWFVIGAMVGSFLNVCVYRLPREQSIVRPRSRCTHCRHTIVWYDNIPLLSYFILRGRCRSCQKPIHWRYPLVEALGGLAAVLVLQHFGAGALGLIYLVFVWSLIVVSFIDLEFQIIPDEISIDGRWVGTFLSFLVPALHGTASRELALGRATLGVLVGGGLLLGTGMLGSWLFRKEAMGGGDIKLLAMAGSLLGWKAVTVAFFLAPVLAIIPGLAVLLLRRSHVIPYGPFLSLALLIALFYGPTLIQLSGVEDIARFVWSYYGRGPF